MSTIFGGYSNAATKGQKHFFEIDTPTNRVWRLIGPGISGAMGEITFHPRDPKTIYSGTDMGAAFKTTNGGLTWQMLGGASPSNRGMAAGMYPRSIAVAWNNPDIVWFANNRVYKSTSGGEAIRQVEKAPLIWQTKKVYIDPSDDNIVYLHADIIEQRQTRKSDGTLVRTIDGGKTWETVVQWSTNNPHFWSVLVIDRYSKVVEGQGHQGLYLCGYQNLMWSTNGGSTWSDIKGNLPDCVVRDLLVIPTSDKRTILVANCLIDKGNNQFEGYIYKSDDNGQSWVQKTTGISIMKSSYNYFNLANSPADPNTIYYATGRNCRVYRSVNLGETWEIACNKVDMVIQPKINPTAWGGAKVDISILDNYTCCLPLADGGNCRHNQYSWGGMSQFALKVSPSDPNVVAFTHATIIVTTNGGKTWTDICTDLGEPLAQNRWPKGKLPKDTYFVSSDGKSTLITDPDAKFTPASSDHTHLMRSRGMQVIWPRHAAFDPFDPQSTIAVNYADIGLRISRDGGAWWEWAYDLSCMLTSDTTTYGSSVVYDPGVKGRLYTGTGYWAPGDVFRSDDSGRTFQRLHVAPLWAKIKRVKDETGKLSKPIVSRIIIDPSSPKNADKRMLYAGVNDYFQGVSGRPIGGIYKTENGGMTWREVSEGLGPDANIHELKIDEQNSDILYAGVYGKNSASGVKGLFKTTNGGNIWRQIAPDKLGGILDYGISLCRNKSHTIYVLAYPPGKDNGPRKLWRSDNGGDAWVEIEVKYNEKIARINSVTVNPINPDWIYVVKSRDIADAADIGTVLRSKNGGKTWEIIDDDKIPEAMGGDIWSPMMQIDQTDPQRLIYYAPYGLWIGYDPEAPHD